jgi:hypothetical protein
MSASRDSSQKAAFVFSNFYHLYQKENTKPKAESEPLKGVVLSGKADLTVVSPHDQENYKKWIAGEVREGKKGLASDLLELRKARKKLSFLIQEIDDLLKRD